MTILSLLAGLALLCVGGEILVRGAVRSARAFRVSPLLIGLTVVGFGTSTPELATSVIAATEGSPGIAVGNVVGSNIANILLILGISALIAPLAVKPAAFHRDGAVLVASTFACLLAVVAGFLSSLIGGVLVALLVAYVAWAYIKERSPHDGGRETHEHTAENAAPPPRTRLALSIGLTIGGIAGTILGARLLVSAAIELATGMGISQTVIGLTVVAVGTSLPELVVCVIAALRGHGDVCLGNIIGSNIYNVFGILGLTAIIHPIAVPAEIAALDIWVLVGATLLLMVFLRTSWRLNRIEGGVFVAAYAAYLGYLASVA
ncbi:MAG: calcium/sodium antiporter [Zavarzinia sp.]|nr:calcium/sodium antiporter [Zavarzinia sp.]